MINPEQFFNELTANGIDFFTGVPDSLLKSFCRVVEKKSPPRNHVIAANEGAAIALAVGHHLATGRIALVYMQNSGLGNAINPLISLADAAVYAVPILLVIGWRGSPGTDDEPQHRTQGKTTTQMLQTMGIPYVILSPSSKNTKRTIGSAIDEMQETKSPFAIVVKKGTFEEDPAKESKDQYFELMREQVIDLILAGLEHQDIVVSTTGKTSREIFEWRERHGQGHERDFLTVGSMGHASQIALGIALAKPQRRVYCIDGDGAVLMHMGSVAIIGSIAPENFRHIVINNGAHDSVGGQPTVGFKINLTTIAASTGYKNTICVSTESDLLEQIANLQRLEGPIFLEVRVRKGARKDLGRPTTSPLENKNSFMEFLRS